LQPEADTSAAYANTQNERQGLKQKKAKKSKKLLIVVVERQR